MDEKIVMELVKKIDPNILIKSVSDIINNIINSSNECIKELIDNRIAIEIIKIQQQSNLLLEKENKELRKRIEELEAK